MTGNSDESSFFGRFCRFSAGGNFAVRRFQPLFRETWIMPCIAVRLRNGLYKIGSRAVSYDKAQSIARRRGFRTLAIIEPVTRSMVDYIDLC